MTSYLDLILSERYWSWTLVGIVYLLVSLSLRQVFLGKILCEAKNLESSLYSLAKHFYFRNSLAGWIFYILSFLLLVAGWIGWRQFTAQPLAFPVFCVLFPTLYFLSLVFHGRALALALITAFRQRTGIEKEF